MAYRARRPARRPRARRAPRRARRTARRAYARRARPAARRARYVGAGYRLTRPPRQAARMRLRGPTYHMGKDSSIVINHMEYLADVISGVANSAGGSPYTAQTFNINPGLYYWSLLQTLSSAYQEWEPLSFQVILKSTSGNAVYSTNVNTQLGTMGIFGLYSGIGGNQLPQNKQQAEALAPTAVSGPPSKSMVLNIDVRKHSNPLNTFYVRTGNNPANTDIRMYDLGIFGVFTSQLQTTVPQCCAELYVKYSMRLKKPIMNGQMSTNATTALYSTGGTSTGVATGITKANLFSGLVANSNNQLPLTFSTDATGSLITLPSQIYSGNYLVSYGVDAATITPSATGVSVSFVGTSCTPLNVFQTTANGFLNGESPGNAASALTSWGFTHAVNIQTSSALTPAVLRYNGSLLAALTTPSASNLVITPLNGNIITST